MEPAYTLEQTHQLLNLAVAGGRIATWYWYLDSNRLEWSGLCREYLALPPGKAPSFEHFRAVLHPEDRERVEGLILSAIEEKSENYQAEYRVVGPVGAVRWLAATGRVFLNAQGAAQAMAGVIMDITERKATEARLLETLTLFQGIYGRASLGIALTDMQGRLERCNPAYEAMLGYTEVELRGMDFSSMIHPDDRAVNLAVVERLASGEIDSFVIENRYLRRDGLPIWVRKLGSPLPGHEGSSGHMLALVEDVSESRSAAELLAESREWLDLALAGAELATWDVNLVSGQIRHDERYLAMLGYGPDDIEPTQDGWKRQVHPDDLPAVNAAMRAHIAGETRVYEAEYRLRHKDGHWVWILARGKVRYDAEGRPVRATGTQLDITDRKRLATEGADLLRRIEALISGLDRPPGPRQDQAGAPGPGRVHLSPRLREVLALLAEGLTSAQIAQRLGISNETAITHRRNLMRKLGLRNKADLIRYALRHEQQAS
ncbi:MAG: PAS domain-containing protein [Methylococcus sp.]